MRKVKSIFVAAFWANAAMLSAGSDPNDQIKIDSHVFGAIEARSIGPAVMGGRIAALDVVNSDPRVIYVGAASGGLWKSLDAGTTFKPIFDKYTQSIGAIAIDQAHPDTVWVGTGEPWVRNSVSVGTGVYKTTDGGESWQLVGLKNSERISRIRIHPHKANTVFVAALGHLWNSNEQRGVYKTTDGGETWERVLYVDQDTGCADLAMDPQEPDILYAAMWQFRRQPDFFKSGGAGSGIFKSKDGGKTWQKKSQGLPAGDLGRIALGVAPTRPSVVYSVVEAEKSALYRSDDFGENWQEMNSSFNIQIRPFYFGCLVPDPQDYNRVYKPGLTTSVSSDGGKSFSSPFSGLGGGGIHPDHHALWVNPGNPLHLMVGTDGGLYVSHDRGAHWQFLNNLPISQFYRISHDLAQPYQVYGGLQDNGSWVGPSESASGIENSDWRTVGAGDGFYAFPDPTDSDIVYCEYQGGNLFRYHRSTGQTKDIKIYRREGEPRLRFNWNTPFMSSPNDPNVIYAAAQYLFRSSDKGESWQRISPDLTTNDPRKQRQAESGGLSIDNSTAENHCTIYSVSESTLDAAVIWVGTDDGQVQVTTGGGDNWVNVIKNIPNLPDNTWCSGIEASRFDRATAYAVFDGHRTGDMTVYVYKTTDLGASWQSLSSDAITGYAHVIRQDSENRDLLFLGTEFGLFVSVDGGAQWAQFTGNLPNVAVRDIAIHPRESDVIVATHGRGVYIIDDITPLRQITPEVLLSPVHVFESRPIPIKTPTFRQYFPGDGEFVGPNPPEAAMITYYLRKRHLFGESKVQVFNPRGELIKELPGGKRRGINRVPWFMRLAPPKVPPAPVLAARGLFGPMVRAGTYTFRLVKGDTTYDGQIDIIADPNSPYSKEDQSLQHETVMKLYAMQERLAFIAEAVTHTRDQALARAAELREKDMLAKDLREFGQSLNTLHATLVAKGKGGLLSGEEQLREKVVNLYSAVASFGGRPTQSQVDQIAILEKEIEKANADFELIIVKDLNKLNSKLQKKKLPAITMLTKESFLQQSIEK